MPSTHAVAAVCIPFFSLLSLVDFSFEFKFFVILFATFLYTYLSSYSRLYLGMHSPADVFGGLMVGVIVLIGAWIVDFIMLTYNLTLPSVATTIFLLYGMLLLLSPEPLGACPCFEDSACFMGSAAGHLAGISRITDPGVIIRVTPLLFLARWFVGSGILFLGRAIYKPLIRKIVYTVWDNLKLPRHSFLAGSVGNKPVPSPKWDINIAIKFIIYYIIVAHCMEFSPHVFTYLGWW